MQRIAAVDPAAAKGKTKELLDGVRAKLGITPNMMKTTAQSPAVLEAYLAFIGALAGGALGAQLREKLALAVSEANGCQYCVSAHTAIGKKVGLTEADLTDARQSASGNAKTDAALKFARSIVVSQGEVTDGDVKRLKAAGYSDGEVAEIIANVVLNIFTNYFNLVAQTEVDFPEVVLTSKRVA